MDLIQLLVLLIIIGVVMYLINAYTPIPQPIKTLINIVIVLIVILGLLQIFGISTFHIGAPLRR